MVPYKINREEWDDVRSEVIVGDVNRQRANYLQALKSNLGFELRRFKQIIYFLDFNVGEFTVDDIVELFQKRSKGETFCSFTKSTIATLKRLGKIRTSETYACTLKSFMQFRGGTDLPFEGIDSELMQSYESYLKNRGIIPNTTSFYMRILRAIYNRDVEKDLIMQQNPFKHVYTGVDKTVKRAIDLKYIKKIKNINLSAQPKLEVVRDMFLFSFYTRGMSFVDLAFLRKKDLSNGILTYRRRKTGQLLRVKWERCMQVVVDKYYTKDTQYLLPIIKNRAMPERNQYISASTTYNHHLKTIGEMVGVTTALTMYVARHSWASVARSANIPLSIISESMGHDSELTTQIYLASLDPSKVDQANRRILRLL